MLPGTDLVDRPRLTAGWSTRTGTAPTSPASSPRSPATAAASKARRPACGSCRCACSTRRASASSSTVAAGDHLGRRPRRPGHQPEPGRRTDRRARRPRCSTPTVEGRDRARRRRATRPGGQHGDLPGGVSRSDRGRRGRPEPVNTRSFSNTGVVRRHRGAGCRHPLDLVRRSGTATTQSDDGTSMATPYAAAAAALVIGENPKLRPADVRRDARADRPRPRPGRARHARSATA